MTTMTAPGFTIGDWATSTVNDGYGCAWVLEDCTGWDDTPDVRIEFPDRPGGDGAFDAPGNYSARVITLSGTCAAPDAAGRWAAKRRLAQVANDLIGGADLIGYMPDGLAYAAYVKRSSAIKVSNLGLAGFEYEMVLTAPDSRLYSQDSSSVTVGLPAGGPVVGGAWKFPMTFPYGFAGPATSGDGVIAAFNSGTEPAWPVFTVTGPGDNITIADPVSGHSLLIPHLDAYQTLTIDTSPSRGSVLLGGTQPRRDLLGPGSQFFPLEPGLILLRFYADTYTVASVTMTWRPAWL